MSRVAILNLTRLGDLVQTSPVVAGLRRREPDTEIHLIVKSRFRPMAELLPGVDCIHEIDGDRLARALADPESGFLDAYRRISAIAADLAAVRFDRVINLTHSRASAALLALLEPREAVGYTLDRDGLRLVENPWLAHMGVVVRARRLLRHNLVDIYLGAAGLGGSAEPLCVRVPEPERREAGAHLPAGRTLLGVQLGASQDQKTWPVERFAATLRALDARVPGLCCVLLGVAGEREAAGALRDACPELRIRDRVGETDVAGLAATLERLDLLLTGDTGTMHLAAAVGTPTVSVFVGLGNPWETAVYAPGHVAIVSRVECAPCQHHVVCGNPVCHTDIPTEWLAELVRCELVGEPLSGLAALPRAEAFRTRFDIRGLLDLEPVHVRAAGANDLMALAYREWFAERLGLEAFEAGRVLDAARARHGLDAPDWRKALPESLPAGLARLAELGASGARLAADLARAPRERVPALGEALRRVDAAVYTEARGEPLCLPLALALEGGLEGATGAGLSEVARRSAEHYAALSRGSRLLGALIEGEAA